MLIGSAWCLSMLVDLLPNAKTQADYPFGHPIVALLVLSIPGLICFVYGFQLHRNTTDTNIVHAVGAVIFIAVLTLPVGYEWITGERFVTKDYFALKILLLIMIAMPIYVLIANKVRRSAGIPVNGLVGLFSKPFIFLLAFQVWVTLTKLFQSLIPFEKYDDLAYTSILAIPMIVVPFLAAGFVYDKLCAAAGLAHNPFKHSGPKHA